MSIARLFALMTLSTALLSVACDEEGDPDSLEFRNGGSCNGCTLNSPRVNDYGASYINADGEANEDGVILRGILSPLGVVHKLEAINDELVAINNANQAVATGNALVNWQIWFELPGGEPKYVRIFGYAPDIKSWANQAPGITGYALGYFPPMGDPVNLCPESGLNVHDTAVTVISGETYDNELKIVYPGMNRWFTIACRSEAVYKMKLMNYGPNDNFNFTGMPATWQQRQATLKMITADYCGNGVSYTQQGTQVTWRNASNTVNTYPQYLIGTIYREARFNHLGATCLGKPRFVPYDDVDCALPSCNGLAWSAPAEWSTWVR